MCAMKILHDPNILKLHTIICRESIPVDWLLKKMSEFGLHVYTQNFTVLVPFANKNGPHAIEGTNVYGILRAPRIAGTEAVVMSVPYHQGDNMGALALMLSFAEHCRSKFHNSQHDTCTGSPGRGMTLVA